MSSANILIVDDEVQIIKLLTITLQSNGYNVLEAINGKQALTMVAAHPPDLVLLDLGLPDENGHDVLKHLREWFSSPVIIVSVQSSEVDIVKALDNGANDYLIKPFRTGELLARVRSALRKSVTEPNIPIANFAGLSVDFVNRIVKKENVIVKLTATEYALLSMLVRHEGKVLTHQYLLRQVWGPTHQDESQYLRVFIAQLRKKIETDPNRPSRILTESGVGYRFVSISV